MPRKKSVCAAIWRTIARSIGVSLLLSSALALPTAAEEKPEGHLPWVINERLLPAPTAGSRQLRDSIQQTPAPDVEQRRRSVPKSLQEWRSLIEGSTLAGEEQARKLVDQLSVKVRESKMAGVTVRYLEPAQAAEEHRNHLFIHLHGGAYVFSGGFSGVLEAAIIADFTRMQVISVDYRMPPDHPFPAAVEDTVTVYRALLKQYPATSLAMGGTSAGGGLALATVHKLKNQGLPPPAALFGGTPWADLTKASDSLYTNEGIDRILVTYDGALAAAARLYANGEDMKNPLISPVYGTFDKFPPTYLVTGTRDMFLSDTARVHRKLKLAGVTAELNVYEGLSHAGYAFGVNSPEYQQVYGELATFLSRHLR